MNVTEARSKVVQVDMAGKSMNLQITERSLQSSLAALGKFILKIVETVKKIYETLMATIRDARNQFLQSNSYGYCR